MAIEFRCVNCNKLLRVKEESAGKKAKCPECATVLQIPMPGAPPADDDYEIDKPAESPFPNFAAELPPQRPSISANPYQSPAAVDTGVDPIQATIGDGQIVPTRMQIGDVLGYAWSKFKQNMWLLIGSMIVAGIVYVVAAFAVGFILVIAALALGKAGLVLIPVVYLFDFAVAIFLQVGFNIVVLKAAGDRRPELGDLFKGGPFVLSVLGAGILFGLAYLGGLLLLIVPGIIFALMFSQFIFLIIDKNVGVMDSLKLSKQITYGNKGTFFLLGIVVGALPFLLNLTVSVLLQGSNSLLLIAVPILLIFYALYFPFLQVVFATAYLTMSGQLRHSR